MHPQKANDNLRFEVVTDVYDLITFLQWTASAWANPEINVIEAVFRDYVLLSYCRDYLLSYHQLGTKLNNHLCVWINQLSVAVAIVQCNKRGGGGGGGGSEQAAMCAKAKNILILVPHNRIVAFWYISNIPSRISQSKICYNTPMIYIAVFFVEYCYTAGNWLFCL